MGTMLNSYVGPRQGGCLEYNYQEPRERTVDSTKQTGYHNVSNMCAQFAMIYGSKCDSVRGHNRRMRKTGSSAKVQVTFK